MSTPKTTLWECAPHTRAKHEILRRYLQAWFPILAKYNGRIIYIDGFAGPGLYTGGEPGSPIVALTTARDHSAQIQREVGFLFVENDQERFDHLQAVLKETQRPENFQILARKGEFSAVLEESLTRIKERGNANAPIFAFVDPFGFSGVPYKQLRELLQLPKTEVFVLFARDSVNRFLNTDSVARHMQELFGMDNVEIPVGENRLALLKKLYEDRLKQAAKFVGSFSMGNDKGKPVYDLFFASNNRLGYVKMKEAMWSVDETGGFRFSDRDNHSQSSLLEQMAFSPLVRLLAHEFSGKSGVSTDTILTFVEESTIYLDKHMKAALRQMEINTEIDVEPTKSDGSARRGRSFPSGILVNFPVFN